jgi:hypothetical protein
MEPGDDGGDDRYGPSRLIELVYDLEDVEDGEREHHQCPHRKQRTPPRSNPDGPGQEKRADDCGDDEWRRLEIQSEGLFGSLPFDRSPSFALLVTRLPLLGFRSPRPYAAPPLSPSPSRPQPRSPQSRER